MKTGNGNIASFSAEATSHVSISVIPPASDIPFNSTSTDYSQDTLALPAGYLQENLDELDEDLFIWNLVLRQEPIAARVRGPKDETRTIDPPPILELVKSNGRGIAQKITAAQPCLVVKAELWSDDTSTPILKAHRIPVGDQLLMGEVVATGMPLLDDRETTSFFFCFVNLSIRCIGTYTLKFTLYDLSPTSASDILASKTTSRCAIFSQPFTVYPPAEFPGMTVSNALTDTLRDQGIKFVYRKKRSRISDDM